MLTENDLTLSIGPKFYLQSQGWNTFKYLALFCYVICHNKSLFEQAGHCPCPVDGASVRSGGTNSYICKQNI